MTDQMVKGPAQDQPEPTREPGQELGPRGEPGLVFGRPVEDRGFEIVEAGMGLLAGVTIGALVAGPIGAAVGGLAGVAGGFAAGEVLERAAGRVATTTDAGEPE
jgi:hypothetical protein